MSCLGAHFVSFCVFLKHLRFYSRTSKRASRGKDEKDLRRNLPETYRFPVARFVPRKRKMKRSYAREVALLRALPSSSCEQITSQTRVHIALYTLPEAKRAALIKTAECVERFAIANPRRFYRRANSAVAINGFPRCVLAPFVFPPFSSSCHICRSPSTRRSSTPTNRRRLSRCASMHRRVDAHSESNRVRNFPAFRK